MKTTNIKQKTSVWICRVGMWTLISLLTSLPFITKAQEMTGIVNSNYAGLQSLKTNPAMAADTRLRWDVNVFALDVFALNNYVYLPRNSINLIKTIDGTSDNNIVQSDFYTERNKWIYANTSFQLPGLLWTYKGEHTFAIHCQVRTMTNAENVPFHIAKFAYEGISFKPLHDSVWSSGPFDISSMAWLETGLSYSGFIYSKARNYLAFGATLNILRGAAALQANSNSFTYMVPNSDTLVVYNTDTRIAHAVPMADGESILSGSGFSADLGLMFEKKRRYTWSSVYRRNLITTYDYKVGISIIDLGKINFNKNAATLELVDQATVWPDVNKQKFSSINGVDSVINERFYGSKTGSPIGNAFDMLTPVTLAMQGDYNLNDNGYVNLSIQLPLTKAGQSVARKKAITLTPRLESKWTEIQFPVSLYNFRKLQAGFAFRFHSFFFGCDNLLPLLGLDKIYGSSFYFGIKISAFKERYALPDQSKYLPSVKGIFKPFQKNRL